ncbi:hypothetical protein Pla110_15470 [Polystyrenella longa]|uniref:Uncharacterized protein n=1 Tax=Polystyrenella longa TaxID=2528007 RepID=A0A518CKS7_9PLAN|nr:hypothetical protein [Polystyrenella longa]QDU79828.1 hypothetical protein Pla110_15470 [Polystyrenella longa]
MKNTMCKLSGLTAGLMVCTLALCSTGCQSWIGGQTLPSPHYLTDDIQYFPKGPEFRLTNTVRQHEEYRLQQEAIEAGLTE